MITTPLKVFTSSEERREERRQERSRRREEGGGSRKQERRLPSSFRRLFSNKGRVRSDDLLLTNFS